MKIKRVLTNEIYLFFPTDKVLLSELIQAAEEGSYCELYLYLSDLSLLPLAMAARLYCAVRVYC